MDILNIFKGKSPEQHEARGDALFKQGAYGDARIEFEKAIDKIRRRYPEKKNLLEKITSKHREASEALSRSHVATGDEMVDAGDHEEALSFYRLALELTSDELFVSEVQAKINRLVSGADKKDTDTPKGESDEVEFGSSGLDDKVDENPASDGKDSDIAADDDAGEEDKNPEPLVLTDPAEPGAQSEDEIFTVLISSLPDHVQKVYARYGEAFKKGYISLNHGDFQKAVQQLSIAHEENAGSMTYIPLELATAYIHLRNFSKALELLDEYAAQNPYDIRVYQLFCELFWEEGSPKIAMARLSTAPESIRSEKAMQLLAGETLYRIGAYDAAENTFMQAIRIHGKDELLMRGLAKIYEARGEIVKARESYAWILNHNAGCGCSIDPFIKRRYADLCFKSGDRSARLLEIYFSLVTDDPDNLEETFSVIASIYEDKGNRAEAERYRALSGKAAARR